MNFIPAPGWIVDEWFYDPKVHGILQNVIQVLTWHPRPSLVKGPKRHGRKIHATASWVITNHYFILLMIFGDRERRR
jgi:hypothetical protein